MTRAGTVALCVLCAACSARKAVPSADGPIPTGYVARVATEVVSKDTVDGIAAAQHVTPKAALDLAVSDTLFALEGRRRLAPPGIQVAERRSLARLLLETTWAEARNAGPPTNAEVATETARRWWEIDRPPLARATHAIVLVKPETDGTKARAFAQRVASSLAGLSDAGAFRAAATSLKQEGLELRVEDLEPVAANGFSVDPNNLPPPGSRPAEFDHDFVEAVFKIPGVGRQSGIVKSSFGYHVILLTEMIPEHRVPLEERRKLLEPDIVLSRATKARDAALERARSADAVVVERASGELTEKVNVTP